MKATGIIRRIDELGRIVIPKELRRTLMGHLNGYAAFKSEDRMKAHKNRLAEQRRIRQEENEEAKEHD